MACRGADFRFPATVWLPVAGLLIVTALLICGAPSVAQDNKAPVELQTQDDLSTAEQSSFVPRHQAD